LLFSVIDVFGCNVQVGINRWNTKILRQRPHFNGQEHRVEDAIKNPESVYQGNTANHKEFKGFKASGNGFYFGGMSVVAVIWYPPGQANGVLTTVYTTSQALHGKKIWTHP